MSIKIMLVDDHQMVREGFRNLINEEEDMTVRYEAQDGRKAIDLINQSPPDVILMDVAMPDMNGVEATQQILNKHPDIKIIGLSIYSEPQFIKQMFKNGAMGYLVKNGPFQEVIDAIRTVMDNRVYIGSRFASDAFKELMQSEGDSDGASPLTVLSDREREVLQLLAEGNSTREIADMLDIGVKTVDTYRWRLMKKLDINNLADLTKFAIREGVITV